MKRRNAIKLAAGALAAGGVGAVTLATAFKPEIKEAATPHKLEDNPLNSEYKYVTLNATETAKLAYQLYPQGSCMYGAFGAVIMQLAKKLGEPFASFPVQMMKYGHGGVGGYGTVCGTLNGAAAVFGLLIPDKGIQNLLIADLFKWYEQGAFPKFEPEKPAHEFEIPKSVAKSVLCHASTTRWGKKAGYTIASKERKERCRRLTADIAAKTVEILNAYHDNSLLVEAHDDETARTCMTCHGNKGKLGNTSGNMNCTSCHDESLAHKVFADSHHKFMDKR